MQLAASTNDSEQRRTRPDSSSSTRHLRFGGDRLRAAVEDQQLEPFLHEVFCDVWRTGADKRDLPPPPTRVVGHPAGGAG